TQVLSHKDFEDRAEFDAEVSNILETAGIELVVLAGYMRILSEDFVNRWRDRLINIHPALLPAFKGLHVHERALDAGVRITGATVHFVRLGTDEGPIIIQGALPVQPDDTPETLEARTLKIEHQILPEAVTLIAEKRVRVVSEQVQIEKLPQEPDVVLIVPAIT
ncbi:MAG: phosphoribosylglycinamide formyltransferase, partial [Paracoccaceae bacterium]